MIISRRTALAAAGASGLLIINRSYAAAAAPEATTKYGKVRGFVRNDVNIFLGMPYGASTAGARRFMPPVAPAAWSGVRDATKLGQMSPQTRTSQNASDIGDFMSGGRRAELQGLNETVGEDCLCLNVLTPAVDSTRRPVLVYIHGGGYRVGSGATMSLGDRLVKEENIVFVTINHRLGALGYLYLGSLSPKYAEGNPGQLDLIEALKWVRDNISNFGGDPAKVTIVGESGGGGKVGHLLSMPQAQGLFRAAIIESSGTPSAATPAVGTELAKKILDKVKLTTADVDKLQMLPYEQVMEASNREGSPVADGHTLQADAWKTAPVTAARVPLIIGHTSGEPTLGMREADPSTFSLDWNSVGAKVAENLKQPAAAAQAIIAGYKAVYPNENASDIFFRIGTDSGTGRGVLTTATRKSAQEPPVYYYRIEYDSKLTVGLRAFHTVELPLFARLVAQPRAENLSKQIAGAWAAFTRTGGDPNHANLPKWSRFKPDTQQVMIFNETSKAGDDPQMKARAALYNAVGGVPV